MLQSTTLITVARSGQLFGTDQGACGELIADDAWYAILLMVITMTAGTGVIMWLGELITERGVGNGMSILIFTSIAARFPDSLGQILTERGPEVLVGVIGIGILIMVAVIFVEQSQRRIPVQYAKRMVGRRTYGGNNTYIPIKVNMAGVVPVIFASSLLYLPSLIAQFNQPAVGSTAPPAPWVDFINTYLTRGDHPLYMALYFLLIVGFTYFYVAITFNPDEVADNMKKYGGFIPGIRAGRPTAEYLDYVLTRVTLPGSIYLGLVALIPLIALRRDQREPELPVRRHQHPDHGRRRPRDGEADRLPAAAAALRRSPALTARLLIVGPPGAGKGTQAARIAERFHDPDDLDRRHLPREHRQRDRPRQAGQGDRRCGRLRPRRADQRARHRPPQRGRRRRRLPARRLPAHPRPGAVPRRAAGRRTATHWMP